MPPKPFYVFTVSFDKYYYLFLTGAFYRYVAILLRRMNILLWLIADGHQWDEILIVTEFYLYVMCWDILSWINVYRWIFVGLRLGENMDPSMSYWKSARWSKMKNIIKNKKCCTLRWTHEVFQYPLLQLFYNFVVIINSPEVWNFLNLFMNYIFFLSLWFSNILSISVLRIFL